MVIFVLFCCYCFSLIVTFVGMYYSFFCFYFLNMTVNFVLLFWISLIFVMCYVRDSCCSPILVFLPFGLSIYISSFDLFLHPSWVSVSCWEITTWTCNISWLSKLIEELFQFCVCSKIISVQITCSELQNNAVLLSYIVFVYLYCNISISHIVVAYKTIVFGLDSSWLYFESCQWFLSVLFVLNLSPEGISALLLSFLRLCFSLIFLLFLNDCGFPSLCIFCLLATSVILLIIFSNFLMQLVLSSEIPVPIIFFYLLWLLFPTIPSSPFPLFSCAQHVYERQIVCRIFPYFIGVEISCLVIFLFVFYLLLNTEHDKKFLVSINVELIFEIINFTLFFFMKLSDCKNSFVSGFSQQLLFAFFYI